MTEYEKQQLERSSKEILKLSVDMNNWIKEIKSAQDQCGIIRQQIYNAINHDKFKDEQD